MKKRPSLAPIVWFIASGVTVLLLACAGRYGIFRDEFYYLMCAEHPAWGYVDHPPLAMVFLSAWKALFGASVMALRVPAALLAGMSVLGAALLAREMRGTAHAQSIAALAVGLMPGMLALGSFFSMNSFDVVFWLFAAWLVCRLCDPAGSRSYWWLLAFMIGIGLLNKYSMGFLAAGLGIGILFSPLRREVWSKRLLALLIPCVVVLPHILWQLRHGWPSLEFIKNAHNLKNVALDPLSFWLEQLLFAHPLFFPLGIIGLIGLLFSSKLRSWRPLGLAFLVIGIGLTLTNAKVYYLVPAYPMIMAAGAVVAGHWLSKLRKGKQVIAALVALLLLTAGAVTVPLAIPLLPVTGYTAYEHTLGIRPKQMEHNVAGALPQHFADRFGWPELARTVSGVASSLQAGSKKVLVLAANYGECGAINYYGLPAGIPAAVSGHNTCFLWWPADYVPDVVILVGFSRKTADKLFDSVELAATHTSRWAMPYEQDLPVWLCREPKYAWERIRKAMRFAI